MTRCRCICFSLITRSFSEPQTILAIKAIEVMCFVAFIIFKISFNNEDIVVSYNVPFLPTLNSQTVKLFFSQDCQQLDTKMAANLALILGHPIRRDLEILLVAWTFHGRLVVHLLFRLEGLYYIVIALSFCCCCRNPGCCSVIVEKDDRSSGGKLIKKKGRRGRKGARIPFLESEWRRRNLSPSFSLLPGCARRFRALVPTN